MKLNPIHLIHELSAGMSESEMRCMVYDLRNLRFLDQSEALALSHLLEDLHKLNLELKQKLEMLGAT